MAVTAAELGLNSVNMFVIVSAAFTGWLLAEKTVISTPRWSGLRRCLAIGYLASAGGLGFGAFLLFGTANAALEFAKETAIKCGHSDHSLLLLVYEVGHEWVRISAMVATAFAVLWVILVFKSSVENDGNKSVGKN